VSADAVHHVFSFREMDSVFAGPSAYQGGVSNKR
jgi:hypothetical protein